MVEQGRGSLPFLLLHGESLVACASWALGAAEITAVDLGTPWEAILDAGDSFVVHDSLCPLTPAAFLAACVADAVAGGGVVVGVRPITDTVKSMRDGALGATVDRSSLLVLATPIVLSPSAVAKLDGLDLGEDADLAALVARLATQLEVRTVLAPPAARRVTGLDDVRLLEALTTRS